MAGRPIRPRLLSWWRALFRELSLTERVRERLAMVVDPEKRGQPLFTSPKGHRLNKRNWRRRSFADAVKAAGLDYFEGLSPHDLRHACASWLFDAGVPVLRFSRHLGHSSIRVTESTYIHLMPGDASTAAALDARRGLETAA